MCYLIFFYSTKCTSSNNEFTDQNNIYSDENIQKTGIIRNVELWRKRLRIYYEITRKYPIFTDSLGSVNLNNSYLIVVVIIVFFYHLHSLYYTIAISKF